MRDVETILAKADWLDRFSGELISADADSLQVSQMLLEHPPRWISALMSLRNRIVAIAGLKTVAFVAGASAGGFPVVSSTPQRTVLGFDDRHLNFRIVVDIREGADRRYLDVTTLVRRNNLLGRLYLLAVGPFHRRIVPATMRPICVNVMPVIREDGKPTRRA
ncbi:DUF2867 domain-containing protein [Agrobacterium sp. NPDC090273]|uniref:DUF2867 domain-containing protein n=1 Tax=Agrobacterium sp. NPDC090273 TaxID=3363919 RepID=UPI00383ABC2D